MALRASQIYPHSPPKIGDPRPSWSSGRYTNITRRSMALRASQTRVPTSGRYTNITRRSMALRASQTRVPNISPLTRGNYIVEFLAGWFRGQSRTFLWPFIGLWQAAQVGFALAILPCSLRPLATSGTSATEQKVSVYLIHCFFAVSTCYPLPGVVGGTPWTCILCLSSLFFRASFFGCLVSMVFIGSGVISLSSCTAAWSLSSLTAQRNVWYTSST